MNPLRETFHFLYASRLKKNDFQPTFTALGTSTIFASLNLLAVTMLTDSFTGYFSWLAKHGYPTVAVVALSMFAIGTVQYFCWIRNGKLEREHAHFENGAPQRAVRVYAYVVLSILALPASGILMRHLNA